MFKTIFVLGCVLAVTHGLQVAGLAEANDHPAVPPALVAIKQKLRQNALHREKAEDHQTRSLELEKLKPPKRIRRC
jgi:hypothetical protein